MELCQMEAFVSVNNHTEVLRSHCIGCGVCVNICAAKANYPYENRKRNRTALDSREMYKKMIMERYGVIGTLKFMGKAALGRKI